MKAFPKAVPWAVGLAAMTAEHSVDQLVAMKVGMSVVSTAVL